MAKRSNKPARAVTQPGMRIQREDAVVAGGILDRGGLVMSLRRSPVARTAPKVRGNQRLSRSEVWEKMEGAMQTLRAMPDRERRFFIVKSGYPDYVHEYIDAYASVEAIAPRYQPTPKQVSEYLDVLAWARHLDKREWRLLWWRSFGLSFGIIGKYIGRSDEAARKRFENVLTDVWTAANGV